MTIFRKKVGAEPRDQIPLAPENSTRRAPQVRASFDAAVSVLAELEGEVAQFALDAIERQPGAAEKLVAQRGRIDAARRPRTNYAPRLSWQSIWIPKRTPLALHRFVPSSWRSSSEAAPSASRHSPRSFSA